MHYGEKSFNLDIIERKSVMEALFSKKSVDSFEQDKSISIRNIVKGYKQIQNHSTFSDDMLPYFVDWLLQKVDLVEITAVTEDHAYTVFETMNDRGISLTPTDMLRGYLLSRITDTEKRDGARKVWDDKIQKLKELGKDEDSEAIKAWLRSQFANTVSDYEGIGAKFHRWVRDEKNINEKLELPTSDSCVSFIEQDFEFYISWYLCLRVAANSIKSGLECIFYNAQNNFTLQYTLLLSPLRVGDKDEEALRKLHIVLTYLDIFINRRIWNGDSIARNRMDDYIWREHQVMNAYKLSSIIPQIRGKSSDELKEILYERIQVETKPFGNKMLHLHGQNGPKIHEILARMTNYIEVESKKPSLYTEYSRRKGDNRYEIEHIWANNYEMHQDEFSHQSEFEAYRDRIGGLLLLPKNNNISYGNSSYNEKREYYLQENLLAQSLLEKAYENKSGFSGFKQFKDRSQLPFRPHPDFKKKDLDERQKLYQLIAKRIWNPERLRLPYGDEPDPITEWDKHDDKTTPNPYDEEKIWTAEQVSNLVPPERRSDYIKTHSSHKMHDCYAMIADLKNLISDKNWNLTLKFQKYYCAFYIADRRVFGTHLRSSPRFAVWISKTEAESLSEHYNFANYSANSRYAIYPKDTMVDSLLPILKFAYNKHKR